MRTQLAGSGRDGLRRGHGPGLRRRYVARHQLVPHFGVQIGAHQSASARWLCCWAFLSCSGSAEFSEYPSIFRHAPNTSGGSSSMVSFPASRASHRSDQARGAACRVCSIDDSGGAVHVGNAPFADSGSQGGLLERRVQALQIGQPLMSQRSQQTHVAHRLDVFGGRKDHVPSGVAAHDLGEHLRNAFVGSVANAHAEFALEVGDGIGRDVVGPVVDVEARAACEQAAAARCCR